MSNFFGKIINVTFLKVIALPIDLLTSVLIVRNLNSYNYGIYIILFLVPNLISAFGSLGIGPSIVYHLGKKKISITKTFFTFAILALLIGFIYYYLINYLLIDQLDTYFIKGRFSITFLKISSLIIPLSLLQKYLRKILQGLNLVEEFTVTSGILFSIIKILVIYSIFYIFKTSFESLIWSIVVINLIVTFIIIFIFIRYHLLNINEIGFLDLKDFKSVLKFALKGHVGSVIQKTNDQITQIISLNLLGPSEVAYISLALKITSILRMLIGNIQTVLIPKIARSSLVNVKIIIPKVTRVLTLLIVSSSIIFMLLIPYLIKILYGKDFLEVINLSFLLIPGIILITICKVFNLTLFHTGSPHLLSKIRFVGLAVNLLIISFLIRIYGELGYSISLSLSYGVMFLVSYIYFWKKFKITFQELFFLKVEDVKFLKKNIRNLLSNNI